MNVCCPCDELIHPSKPDIAAGLPGLPRQLAGFPEYRLAMLRAIPTHPALARWRARQGEDLGIMLLEMWAYVLDILAFYDERIANESYLRTATLRPSTRKLVGLIGYQPRPALAASVVLAAIADGNRLVKLPSRTGFRSDAFDGEPPQVFETEFEHTIHLLKNEWSLGPVREMTVGDRLLLEADTARLSRDQIALFLWPAAQSGNQIARAGKVVQAKPIEGRDGQAYLEIVVEPPLQFDPGVKLKDVRVLSPKLSAALHLGSAFTLTNAGVSASFQPGRVVLLAQLRAGSEGELFNASKGTARKDAQGSSKIKLDAVYRQIHRGDLIVISRNSEFRPFKVVRASETEVEISEAVKIQVTMLEISPPLPKDFSLRTLTVHFDMADAGTLTRVAGVRLHPDDFVLPGLSVEGDVEQIPQGVARPAKLLLLDGQDKGALAKGSVDIDANGKGKVHLNSDSPPFEGTLRTPVAVFGNLVGATRGESVFGEVLGSGAASQAFQSFTLGNQPLTYLNDPSAPNGRRSVLEVRVNGIKWKEVTSFFGIGPEEEVYIVRQNDDGESVVTFGDGLTGARLPTGVDNVAVTYRFGAGAAKPPAGAIGQLATPVEGLRRVVNPVAAGGGADADQPKDIRRNAPNSALTLGRAVSVPDFEALAREFGGVLNAHVEWAWDESSQHAVVKVWFISDGGDILKELRAFLIGQADPTTPLIAVQAELQPSQLVIDLEIDARFNGQTVIQEVRQALLNPDTGILALQNVPIGLPLFRSKILEVVLSVEGARLVRAMTVDGKSAPFAITVGQGRYRDFLDGLVVEGESV